MVRLSGPRRVEVHLPGEPVRTAGPGEELEAPGILKHRVLVESLYDEEIANKVALRNLLEREGHPSLEKVRAESEMETLRANLLAVFEARQLEVGEAVRSTIADCRDPERLRRWNVAAITASSAEAALDA